MHTTHSTTHSYRAVLRLLGRLVRCRIAFAIAIVFTFTPVATLHAQFGGIVFDPKNFARNVMQYERRLEQMAMQRQQLQQQLTAMRKLANPPWRDIRSTVTQLNAVMGREQSLSYDIQNLDAQFQATFPVAQPFQNWQTDRKGQAERTVATMGSVLDNARLQADEIPAGLDRLAQMKQLVGSEQGHEQALELQNSETVFTGQELLLLRQALMAQSAMQAVYYADQVNAQEQQAATIDERLTELSAPATRSAPVSLRIRP